MFFFWKKYNFNDISGIENLVHPPLGGETPSVNEEPIITMSMTPIQSLSQPEEVGVLFFYSAS